MIPLITKVPPSLTETSIPVDVKNTEPIKVKGTLTISGDEDNPLPTKIISDENHPVLVDVVNENFNVYINNPSPIDVNVTNQLELPEIYPITSTNPLGVTVTNPTQLPSKYKIDNDFYGNELIFYHTSMNNYLKLSQTTFTSCDISVLSPLDINITNFNQWFFSISSVVLLGVSNDSEKFFELTLSRGLDNIDYSGLNIYTDGVNPPSSVKFVVNQKISTPLISFKGNYSKNSVILHLNLLKGDYSQLSTQILLYYSINFYCRSRYYPN